jgi:hypothetical protein
LTVDEGVVGFKGRDYVVQYMCWTLFWIVSYNETMIMKRS